MPTPTRRLAPAGAVVAVVLVVAGTLLATTRPPPSTPAPAPVTAAPAPPVERPAVAPIEPGPTTTTPPVETAPLVDPGVDLRAGPVAVPLRLDLPSIGVRAEILGVGLTEEDTMDAPQGDLDDPVWQQAFWYRGSAVPGAASTALIAGHVGSRGGPGAFARLGELVPGDPIVVQDERTGLGTRFVVTETAEYTLDEAARPDVLARIYGAGPVAGTGPQPSTDGRARLTLVTCSGTFRGETHDRRRVVSAVAVPTDQP